MQDMSDKSGTNWIKFDGEKWQPVDMTGAPRSVPPVTPAEHEAALEAQRPNAMTKPRYFVVSVPNKYTGTHFQVCDSNNIFADFFDVRHFQGDHMFIDVECGFQNAQIFCQILNVTEEASRV